MKNLAFQDILGGSINVYSKNNHLPRQQRINAAFKELEHTGDIKIYLLKGRKLKLIGIRRK